MLSPETTSIEVFRAENGWVVRASSYYRSNDGMSGPVHVARTPKELADMIQEWAQAQGDLPKK